MNQNSFCTKCHRIPSQCVCGNTQRELTDEEIMQVYKDALGIKLSTDMIIDFAQLILKKASEK